jgi:hypothetical protein
MEWKTRHTAAALILALLYSLPNIAEGISFWIGSLIGGAVVMGIIVYIMWAIAQRLFGDDGDDKGETEPAEAEGSASASAAQ